MSAYRKNHQPTLNALVIRKVQPLGAAEPIIRSAQRRAWRAVCRGARAPAAIRDAVNWAALHTDKPASRGEEPTR